jgi:RNA polymerase sigma factor (sigma-70 family)
MRMRAGAGVTVADRAAIRAWFMQEVLPLEDSLTGYIRRHWRSAAEAEDIRHEVYAKLIAAARDGFPANTRAFVFTTAKHHLINLARRAQVVSFDYVADLESLGVLSDEVGPDRHLAARDELRLLKEGLERLPPRVREVILLRRLDGLSRQETADRLGVSLSSVEHDLVYGTRALVDFMMGGSGKVVRSAAPKAAVGGEP